MEDKFFELFFKASNKYSIIDYLNNSSYDDLGEIDLNNDTFTPICQIEGKYFAVLVNGSYRSLYENALNNIVHQDDRKVFEDLMNPDCILERLQTSKTPNFRCEQLRYRLYDGTYRYVRQCVITGKENGLNEGIIRFYVFDIQNEINHSIGKDGKNEDLKLLKRDNKTGLLVESAFIEKASEIVKKDIQTTWCVVSIDVENFKLFDEWYGREKGDNLLAKIGEILLENEKKRGGVAGYFGLDDFSILMPYDMNHISQIFDEIRIQILSFELSVGFMPAFGVYILEDDLSIVDGLRHASLASNVAKKDFQTRIYVYDSKMQQQAEQEYRILIDFMHGLNNGEVTFYLQPQCHIETKQIVGAESLARWIRKDGQIISPTIFVPILEKFGFIADLDKYIWNKTCRWLRSWIDQGHEAVPISLNVSKVDIYTIDVINYFQLLIRQYRLSPDLLKIEITESTYAENTKKMEEVVSNLRKMGFNVLMDDFGSGYSSLNMLSKLKVDIIKLDALFIKITKKDYEKRIQILESIVNMTKVLALPVIVEGVETKEQVDFLKGLGCSYVQGFYYYYPMPIEQFEKIIENKDNINNQGFICKTNEQFRVRELLDRNIYSDTMLNNLIGPAAFYSWHGKAVDIIRFNQQFYEDVNDPKFLSRLISIQNFMPSEDASKMYDLLNRAINNRLTGSKGILRFYKIDGTLTTYEILFYYLGFKENSDRFIGIVENLTDIVSLQSQINILSKYCSETILFINRSEKQDFVVATYNLQDYLGLSFEKFKKEIVNDTFKNRIVDDLFDVNIDFKTFIYQNKFDTSITLSVLNSNKKIIKLTLKILPVQDKTSNIAYVVLLNAS